MPPIRSIFQSYILCFRRHSHYSNRQRQQSANTDAMLYSCAAIVGFVGLVYASVPLYRLFCQQTGFGGTPIMLSQQDQQRLLDPSKLSPVHGAPPINIRFEATTSRQLSWSFTPQQTSLQVRPGQTALAFYAASNHGDRETSGIATYNVIPAKAAPYFNKIQCFCFEEQRLGPGEQIDMPVFFYIDPEWALDPAMDRVREVVLAYTFFPSTTSI